MTFRNVKNDYDYKEGANENGRVIVRNTQSGRLELSIDSLLPNDTANYTCKSHNEGGFAEQNGTIIVEFAPIFPEQETMYYGWTGKRRNVTCHTYSEPAPVFEWWHLNRELQNNETFTIIPLIKNCVLQIYTMEGDSLWIYGDYECRPRNQHGESNKVFNFEEATQPDPPESAKVVEQSPTMVILNITDPINDGGMPIIGYRVEFESIHANFRVNEEVRIENLIPSHTYRFNVRAQNEVDFSAPFVLAHDMLPMSEPYKIVIISDPYGFYPYDYTLLWEKPLTGGIPIKEYRFRYRRVTVTIEIDGSFEIVDIIDDWIVRYKEDDEDYPMSSYRLEGLKPDNYYQVEIEARNDIGWSETSDEFVFHTSSDGLPVKGNAKIITPLLYIYLISSTFCLLTVKIF